MIVPGLWKALQGQAGSRDGFTPSVLASGSRAAEISVVL